jgi:hypothetical protein
MIFSRVATSGDGTVKWHTLWNLNPAHQYCWFCRGRWGSQWPPVIFAMSEVRMATTGYRKRR